MKKAIVIGCPGSGKSTFSLKLSEITGIPVFHLDNLFWNEDKTNVSNDIFDMRLDEVLKKEEWIIDGNFGRTLRKRFEACDTVFFYDLTVDVCLKGVEERMGKPRVDCPFFETEEDPEFVDFIVNFEENGGSLARELINEFSFKEIHVFNSRKESDDFIFNYNK